MSIDSRMLSLERYEDDMMEWVNEVMFKVYEDLAQGHIDQYLVNMCDLIEFTYGDIYIEIRDNMIADALEQYEHEKHGLEQDEFIAACYSGRIEHESTMPHIEQSVLRGKIIEAINRSQLFVQDGAHLENSPLIGVW